MIDGIPVRGRTVAVMGLAKSGLTAARALGAAGAVVRAWDDSAERRAEAAAAGIPIADLTAADGLAGVASLVLSPGIPHTHPAPHPVAAAARLAGIEIIGDVELLGRADPAAHTVAITGTNGKSTTTALVGHIFRTAARRVAVGGNLGPPVLDFPPMGAEGWYVLELSSYQLELTFSIAHDVAILLNITPDHLARHGGMAGYIAAKALVFERRAAGKPQTAVIGADDPDCRALAEELRRQGGWTVVPISGAGPAAGGVYAVDGRLFDATGGAPVEVMDLGEAPALPGAHNWQNAAAAWAAARAAGIDPPAIAAAMRSFPGLAHRQELVGTLDGVRFVNDSKATNADATAKALGCYDAIYWILGGQPKESGLDGLEPFMARIRHAFLIGAATEHFAAWLEAHGVSFSRCGELSVAVTAAAGQAAADRRPGAVVLLSPACASFDQFANFEARGAAFAGLVGALRDRVAAQGERP